MLRSLTVGGYGELELLGRGFHRALDAVMKVPFALRDIPDPAQPQGRPSALSIHRKRHIRIRIYRELARAGGAALQEFRPDRNREKREERRLRTESRDAKRFGALDRAVAAEDALEQMLRRKGDVARWRKERSKAATDWFVVQLHVVLGEFTKLRGKRRLEVIGKIIGSLNLGSRDPEAIRQRITRLPSEMKIRANAYKRSLHSRK